LRKQKNGVTVAVDKFEVVAEGDAQKGRCWTGIPFVGSPLFTTVTKENPFRVSLNR
jgi:hypothetical protein